MRQGTQNEAYVFSFFIKINKGIVCAYSGNMCIII